MILDTRTCSQARLSRDSRFDGRFFTGVKGTRIYCRSICPVRTVKEQNIIYFPTAAAATEAGFRPCLRCRPEAAPGTPAWLGVSAVVRRALKLIDDGALDMGSVDCLAASVGIGSRHLHRLFVRYVGASPIAVAQTRRLNFAKRLLDETDLPMTEIALASGYGSLRRFNFALKSSYGRSPRDLRKMRRKGFTPESGDDVILKLAYRPPYDWYHTLQFLAARAIRGVERVDSNSYSRTIASDSGHITICLRTLEDENALELRVRGATPVELFQLFSNARRVFDLDANAELIVRAFGRDEILGPLVKKRPGLRIPGVWSPFECVVRAVLGQQVSVAAGRTLAERLVQRAGLPITSGMDGLTHEFPTPKALASADLDGLGLTTSRATALKSLACAVADGSVDLNRSSEEVMSALTALSGFGDWTAQYVALRGLGEPDAFPASDLVLRRVAAGGQAPLTLKAIESMADSWRPWRGYAAFHLWRAAGETVSELQRHDLQDRSEKSQRVGAA